MKKEDMHNVTFRRDPDGRTVVGVQLSNRADRAWLYLSDYERVIRVNGAGNWFVNLGDSDREYVRISGADRRPAMVSRLIVGPGPKERVRYHDGNPWNLRRTNLKVVRARSRAKKVEGVTRRAH